MQSRNGLQNAAEEKIHAPCSSLTRRQLVSLAGVLLATLAAYELTFSFGWVYDDVPQIPQNPNLLWSRIGYLFTHQLWASTSGTQGRFYRPLLSLWFLINKTLFGLNPHWFHVTSVLAHVTATALAFFFARELLRDTGASLFVAAIFGLHPIQTESAAWISSVNDPLAAICCFSSFLLYRKAKVATRSRSLWWASSAIPFLLALLTKEVSVVLPAIVLIDIWADRRREPHAASSRRFFAAALGIAGALWFALRAKALGGLASSSSLLPWNEIFLSAPRILLFNLRRIIVPVGLSPQYDFHLVHSAASMHFLVPFVILLALAGLAVIIARRDPRLWVALAWLLLPLLPTLNLRWMNEDDFIHDRYLYMSMLGAALLAGSGYAWLKKNLPIHRLAFLLGFAIAFSLGFASVIQSLYWMNDVILFSRAVEIAPNNEWAQLNYGSALSSKGKHAEAASHFARSYEIRPGWRAAAFAGFAYQQSGDLSQAGRWFTAAVQQNPDFAPAWFGLGQVCLQQHRPEDAVGYLKKALQLQPEADGYHYELGAAFERLSRPADAMEEYNTELRLHPYQVGAQKALDRLQAVPPGKH
jgi:protein O-mannosyl-transferase